MNLSKQSSDCSLVYPTTLEFSYFIVQQVLLLTICNSLLIIAYVLLHINYLQLKHVVESHLAT
jgi:hypothetical protein